MSVHVLGQLDVADLDRFLAVFAGEGHDKRWEHGCLGAEVYTTLDDASRVTVLLEFPDVEAFEGFRSDPTAPPIMSKGGAQGPPTFTVLRQAATFEH